VSTRLGVSTHSLYAWVKKYSLPAPIRTQHDQQEARIKQLQADLRRVTEERDILKKATAYFAKLTK